MNRLWKIDESHEGRRPGPHLGGVVELEPFALVQGRYRAGDGLFENLVDLAGAKPRLILIEDGIHQWENPLHALAGLCRDGQHGGKGQKLGRIAQLKLHASGGARIARHHIPFVDHEDAAAAAVLGIAGNAHVLVGDPLRGIQNHQGHIAALQAAQGFDHRKLFDFGGDLPLAPNPGRIDEQVFFPVADQTGIDGITGRPGQVADHQTFLPQNPVDEGGFAHVGTSHHGDAHCCILLGVIVRRRGGQSLDKGIQKIGNPVTVLGRYRVQRLHAQGKKLVQGRLQVLPVDLVHRVEHLPRVVAQPGHQFAVERRHAAATVEKHHHKIRLGDGLVHLGADLGGEGIRIAL